MKISANEARKRVADIEKRFEEGRIRQEHYWITTKSPWSWSYDDYGDDDDGPDQGVHRFDGGGTFF